MEKLCWRLIKNRKMTIPDLTKIVIFCVLLQLGATAQVENYCDAPIPVDKKIHIVAAKTIRARTDYKIQVQSYHKDVVNVFAEIESCQKKNPASFVCTYKSLVSSERLNLLPNDKLTLVLKVEEFSESLDHFLKVSVKRLRGSEVNDRIQLTVLRDFSLVMIRFDKPKYKPGDTVNYHILIVDENLLPVGAPIDVNIKNPNGELVHQNQKQLPTYPGHPGFVQGSFLTNKYDILGNWSVEVGTGKQTETRTFEVADYVLPRFLVSLDVSPYVVASEPNLEVKVNCNKPYLDRSINVRSQSTLHVTGPNNFAKTWTNEASDQPVEFLVPLDDLFRGFCTGGSTQSKGLLNVSVTATEILSEKSQTETVSVRFFCDEFEFLVKQKSDFFLPGIPFEIEVEIVDHDGKSFKGDDFSSDSVTIIIGYSENRLEISGAKIEKKIEKMKKSTKINFFLEPKIATERIDVRIKLQNSQKHFVVFGPSLPSSRATYMSVQQIENHKKANQTTTLNFKVSCSQTCPAIQYIVISRNDVVFHGSKNVSGALEHSLSLKIERNMAPSSTLVVYYLIPGCYRNVETVSASTDFQVDGLIQNTVDLSVRPETKRQDNFVLPGQDPKENATIQVITKGGSLVGTLAVDKRWLLGRTNKLTNEGLLQEIFELERKRSENSLPSATSASDVFEKSGLIELLLSLETFPVFAAAAAAAHGISGGDVAPVASEQEDDWTPILSTRSDFRDSFFFNVFQTNESGLVSHSAAVPDSITTWEVFAFSLHNRFGLAFSGSPKPLEVYQQFFVDIDMPKEMIRTEKITIDFVTTSHLPKRERYQLKIAIFYSRNTSEKVQNGTQTRDNIPIESNENQKTSITITPIFTGEIVVEATATIFENQKIKFSDKIIRTLMVIPEGIKREETSETYPIVAGKRLEIPVDISQFSANMVKGSMAVQLAVFGGSWAPIVSTLLSKSEDLRKLVKLPHGCAEQNMAVFMPNLFVAKYLEKIGYFEKYPSRRKISEQNIETGYKRQFKFRLEDYSFSAFGKEDSSTPGSTWLTAYVLRGFISAREYVKNPRNFDESFNFLESRQAPNGSFLEFGFIVDRKFSGEAIHSGEAALTAFVVLAFAEGNKTGQVLEKAKNYLKDVVRQFDQSPYTLAIVTYALAKLNCDQEARNAARKLIRMGTLKNEFHFWTENPKEISPSAKTIETTAYAILAFEELGLYNNTQPALKWLLSIKRSVNGGFVSTQDTVVALTALSKVASRVEDDAMNLNVMIRYEPSGQTKNMNVRKENMLLYRPFNIPANTTKIIVQAQGRGTALSRLSYHFNEHPNATADNKFCLNARVERDIHNPNQEMLFVDSSYNGSTGGVDGQIILQASALTGYEFDENMKDTLMNDLSLGVGDVELGPGRTSAIVYFNKLNRTIKTFQLPLLRSTGTMCYNRKRRPLAIYEYYEPDYSYSSSYSR